jgi:hypothetical protein
MIIKSELVRFWELIKYIYGKYIYTEIFKQLN